MVPNRPIPEVAVPDYPNRFKRLRFDGRLQFMHMNQTP